MKNNKSEYITYEEVKRKYEFTEYELRECNKRKSKNRNVYLKSDVEKLFKEEQKKLKRVDDLINSGDWIQFSKIKDKKIQGKIVRAFIKNNRLKEENQVIVMLKGKKRFIRKDFIAEINSSEFLKSQIYGMIENEKYILASEIKDKYGLSKRELEKCFKEKRGRENIYLRNDVEKIFNDKEKKIKEFENLKNSEEWLQFSKIENKKLKNKVARALKRDKKLKEENQLIIEGIDGKRAFVKKIFVNEVSKAEFWELQKYKKIKNTEQGIYISIKDVEKKYELTRDDVKECYKEKCGNLNFYLESDVKKKFEEKQKKIEEAKKIRNNVEWIEFTEIENEKIKNKINNIFQRNFKIKNENQVKVKCVEGEKRFIRKKFVNEINNIMLKESEIIILENKKYITKTEIKKIYGLTEYQLKNCNRKKIKNRNFYFEDEVKKIFDEKENKIKEVKNLVDSGEWIQMSMIEDSKIQGRIIRILKKNENLKKENQLIIECGEGKRRMIRRSFLNEINKENFFEEMCYGKLDDSIKKEYILSSEIKREYGLKKHQYRNCEKKRIENTYFYLKKDIKRIVKEKYTSDSKVKNREEWILLSELDKKIAQKIKRIFTRHKEKEEKYKAKIIEDNKIRTVVKKSFIENLKNIKSENHFEGFNKLKSFDLNELGNILKKIKFTKKKFNNAVYEIKEIEKYVDIKEGIFKEKVNRTELEELMNRNRMYSLDKMGYILKLAKKSMETLLKNQSDSNYIVIEDLIFFSEKEMEKFLLFIINKRNYDAVRRIDDISILLEKRMEFFKNDRHELKEYIHKYLKLKINKNMKRGEVNRNIDALESLYLNMEKKLELYTDEELIYFLKEKVSDKKIKKGYLGYIAAFINNYRKIKETIYKKEISERLINTNKKKKDEIYSKEVWQKYYLRLTDVKCHIEIAKKNYRYAQIWLYCLENLFLPIRRSDILRITMNIFPESVGIERMEDINEFLSEEKVDIILEQIEMVLNNFQASKNKENIMFLVPSSIKKIFVIAYIICELQRRTLGREKIFSKFNGDIGYKKELFGDEELYDFQNLKCTKSIITYGYSYGINKGKNNYSILSLQRGHKKQDGKLSNTVAEYYLTKEDEILEFVENLMEREAFGFIYYRIMMLILKNREVDLKKITQDIKIIKENVAVFNLENFTEKLFEKEASLKAKKDEIYAMAGAIETKYRNFDEFTVEVIRELYMDNFNILFGDIEIDEKFIDKKIDRIKKIIDTKICNKENFYSSFNDIFKNTHIIKEGIFCLYEKGKERNKYCIYNSNGIGVANCSMCESSMLTLVNLSEISRNLKKIVENMNGNNISEILIKKYNHMIRVYLYILVEAYSFLGVNKTSYFNYLTDFENIKNNLIKLRKEGLLKNE